MRGHHDLNALLSEVLQLYYKDERYLTPSISWSKDFMYSRFGEYQYCDNHIIISRLLDTDKVSEEAIMSVIYHELLHQETSEHPETFQEKLLQFPSYQRLKNELEAHFDAIESIPELDPPRTIDAPLDKIVFVLLPNEYERQYVEQFTYYDKALYLEADRKKPIQTCSVRS